MLRYKINSKCKIQVYLKSNTVCCNLGFSLTIVTINILQFTKDNLLLLIVACLHELIFDMLDHPQYAVFILSAHLIDKRNYQCNMLLNRTNSKCRFESQLSPCGVLLLTIPCTFVLSSADINILNNKLHS